MSSEAIKYIRILLGWFMLAAVLAPVCTGSEGCRMPCCGNLGHGEDLKPCCAQPTDAPAGLGSGCRFVQHPPALPSVGDTGPFTAAAVGAVVLEAPILWSASTPAFRWMDSNPPDTPIYLRLQHLLI